MDWNLLPLYMYRPRISPIPLWSVIDAGAQQYCEFEVKDKVVKDKEDECNENADLHTCYICDTNVPKVYMQEHIQSAKHAAHSAIVDRTLDRIRRQMVLTTYRSAHHGRTFYCPHCSCAVATAYKTTHEISEEHKLSVLHDTLTKCLKLVYENKNNIPKVLDEIAELIKNTEKDQFENRSKNNESITMPDVFVEVTVPGNEELQKITDVKTTIDDENVKNDNIESSESDLEQFSGIVKSLNSQSLQFANKDSIQIQTPSGDKIMFSVDNYLKYKMFLEEKLNIKRCHMQGTTEKNEVTCKICNTTIADKKTAIGDHLNTEEHKTKYNIMLDDNCMTKINDMVTFCTACFAYVLEFEELHHIEGIGHKNNVRDKIIHDDSNDNSENSSEVATNTGKSTESEIENTVTGNVEFIKIRKSLLKRHNIIEFNSDLLFCNVCRDFVNKSSLSYHINKCDHTSNLSKSVNKTKNTVDKSAVKETHSNTNAEIINLPIEMERTDVETNVKCKICKVIVPNTISNINDHLLGARHSKAVNARTEEEKSKNNEHDKKLFDNGGNNQNVTPTLSYADMTRLDNNKTDKVVAEPTKETTKNIQVTSAKVKKALHYLFMITDDPNKVRCKVCSVEFDIEEALAPALLDKHRQSDVHKNEYAAKLERQTMSRIKRNCYCLCCDEVFEINLEYYHMNSSQHKFNLSKCTERLDKVGLNRVAMLKIEDNLTHTENDSSKIEDNTLNKKKKRQRRRKSRNGKATAEATNVETSTKDEPQALKSEIVRSISPEGNDINSDLMNSESNNEDDSSENKDGDFQDIEKSILSETHGYGTSIDEILPEDADDDCVDSCVDYIFLQEIEVKQMETRNSEKNEQNSNNRNIICNACDVVLVDTNIASHNEEKTKKNAELLKNKTVKTTVKQTVSNESNDGNSKNVNAIVEGFCKICNVEVPTDPHNIHANGKKHTKNLKQRLSEEQTKVKPSIFATASSSVANIDKSTGISEQSHETKKNLFFCKICNDSVSQVLAQCHMNSKKHRKKLKKLFKKETNAHVVDAALKTTGDCKTADTVSLASISPTVSTENPPIDNKGQTKLSKQYKGSYFCEICEIYVPHTDSHIKDHISGKIHQQFMKKIFGSIPKNKKKVNASAPKSVDNETSQCDNNIPDPQTSTRNSQTVKVKTDTNFAETTDVLEGNISNTSKNQEDKPEVKNESTIIPDIYTKYKNIVMFSWAEDIQQNINEQNADVTDRESNNVENDTQNNNSSEILSANEIETQIVGNVNAVVSKVDNINDDDKQDTDEPKNCVKDENSDKENDIGFYVCKICKFSVLNDPIEIKSHLASYRHANNKELLKENEEQVYPNIDDKYMCEICGVNIDKSSIAIKTHNETLAHDRRFQKILSENRITMRDNRVCYCQSCDLYFNKFTVGTHIATKNHASLLLQRG